jgi:hypothetical protein
LKDCVFLLADRNIQATFEGFLGRPRFHYSLGTGAFDWDRRDLIVDEGSDPGVYRRAHETLRPFLRTHRHALIVLDEAWAGSPGAARIRHHIVSAMVKNGWDRERFEVVVIVPELESWIWQDKPDIDEALGFRGPGSLREFLQGQGIWPEGQTKPEDPKEILERILRDSRTPRSSSIYRKITSRVSVKSCTDSSFQEMLAALRNWFPPESG